MEKQAKLMVKYGKTINLGNYESQRIDISLEIGVNKEIWQGEAIVLYDHLRELAKNLLDESS